MTYPCRLRIEKAAHLEFLNRVDEVLIFHRLSLARIKQIVQIQLDHLRRRLGDRKIALAVTDRAKEFLACEGYDPMLGARPLKRALQRLMQNPLVRRIQEGAFGEGDAVTVDVEGGEVVFTKAGA